MASPAASPPQPWELPFDLGQYLDLGRHLDRCASVLRPCLGGLGQPAAAPLPAKMIAGQLVFGSAARRSAEQSPAWPPPTRPRSNSPPAAAPTLPPRPEAAASPRLVSTADLSSEGVRRGTSLPPAPIAPTRAAFGPYSALRPAPRLATSQQAASSLRAPVNEERFARFMAQCDSRGPQGGVINRNARDASKSQPREADEEDLSI